MIIRSFDNWIVRSFISIIISKIRSKYWCVSKLGLLKFISCCHDPFTFLKCFGQASGMKGR